MNNFLSLHFWFNSRPGTLMPIYKNILVGIIVAFVILAIVSFFLKKNKKNFYFKFWSKLFTFFSTNAFIGLILFFFNQELIPFFSSRFWYALWGAGIIIWLIFIFKYFKSLPEKKKEIEEKREYKKYIP